MHYKIGFPYLFKGLPPLGIAEGVVIQQTDGVEAAVMEIPDRPMYLRVALRRDDAKLALPRAVPPGVAERESEIVQSVVRRADLGAVQSDRRIDGRSAIVARKK